MNVSYKNRITYGFIPLKNILDEWFKVNNERLKMKQLGKYMQQKRLGAGLTQVKLSEACGFESPQMVSNIERGIVIPSPKYLKTLSNLTGVSVQALVTRIMPIYKTQLLQSIKEAK